MSDNPLDAAFAQEQRRLEIEQEPARRELDELARIIATSQIPNELGFTFNVADKQLTLVRDPYVITAELKGPEIWVYISQPDGSNYQSAMMGALSACSPKASEARGAANHIGELMARIVENRLF